LLPPEGGRDYRRGGSQFRRKDYWGGQKHSFRNYAIVASGGIFTSGKDSIVVPIRSLKVSPERDSFFVVIGHEAIKNIPLMPDQSYMWLSNVAWRNRNDALFAWH
jgi:hypothetical protein